MDSSLPRSVLGQATTRGAAFCTADTVPWDGAKAGADGLGMTGAAPRPQALLIARAARHESGIRQARVKSPRPLGRRVARGVDGAEWTASVVDVAIGGCVMVGLSLGLWKVGAARGLGLARLGDWAWAGRGICPRR